MADRLRTGVQFPPPPPIKKRPPVFQGAFFLLVKIGRMRTPNGFKKRSETVFNRGKLYAPDPEGVKHRDVFHNSLSQINKIAVTLSPLNSGVLFYAQDVQYLKKTGAIFNGIGEDGSDANTQWVQKTVWNRF